MIKAIFLAFLLTFGGDVRKKDNIKVIALGDSITKCFSRECWVKILGQQTEFKTTNKGIGGETLEQMNRRINRDVIKDKPDVCIIMGGTNDVFYKNYDPAKSMAQIHDMVKKLKESKIHAVIGIPLPMTNPILDTKLSKLRMLIYQSGYSTINFFEDFTKVNLRDVMPDGVHPNNLGNEIMAWRAIRDLRAILGE